MPELRYDGDNAQEALIYFKTHRQEMRALRRVTAGPTCTSVQDINGEVMQLCGIALSDPELVILLTQTGASLNPTTVHNLPPRQSTEKAFQITKQDPWGHDRVM